MANRRRIPFLRAPRFRGRGAARRWTAQLLDRQAIVSGVSGRLPLVARTDYASNGLLEPEGPTLTRMRGAVNILTTTGPSTIFIGIGVFDEAAGTGTTDPAAFTNLIDEAFLWWRVYSWQAIAAATPSNFINVEVDIRAKRKLRDSDVYLCWNTTGAAAPCSLSCNIRSLLVGNSAT